MMNNLKYILILYLFTTLIVYAQGDRPFIEVEQLDFQLKNLHGNTIVSTDTIFNNKVIYITLWGTWCPPCISEIPTLINLQNKYSDAGLIIIAIAFEQDEIYDDRRDRLLKFINANNINYLVLDGGTPANFEKAFPTIKNVEGLPIEMLINREGNVEVIRNSFGYNEVWAGRLEQEIKTLLKNY